MLYSYSGSSFSRADESQSVLSLPAVSIPVISARPRPCDAVSLPTVYCTFSLACHAFPRACDVQIFKFQTVPAFQLSRVRRFSSFLSPAARVLRVRVGLFLSFTVCILSLLHIKVNNYFSLLHMIVGLHKLTGLFLCITHNLHSVLFAACRVQLFRHISCRFPCRAF